MTKQHIPYRSREEIISIILEAVKDSESRGGITITRLLYASRLAYFQLKPYLNDLMNNGLITFDLTGKEIAPSLTDLRRKFKSSRRGDIYHLSDRGEKYLQMIEEMKHQMGIKI